ncbi:hypothetical protein [Neorhizobium sp. AL 9.2.2]|uniref:hypothetical protein n=1 Tax=Neorhizobium sp. AL 9.2.2 TaxID=2712894 RepID=UPI001573C048|nr:hypothetical protein [Neorhizobium sp. AL 9.2.2]NSY17247.1 hypothetical protein [Neorhizobium sp. AL 9.2.2]
MPFLTSFFQPQSASRFIDGNFTIATLPLASDNAQKYAWVTDLHDGQPDLVISDGSFWKPVRPLATRVVANSDAPMTLTPLVNSPTQIMRGTLTASRNITLSSSFAYPGAKFRIKREAGGVLLNLNIIGAVTTALGLTAPWMDLEYVAGTGWVQTASGSIL